MLYPVPDVPQYLRSEGPESVALKERARLGLPVAQQLKWENDREAFLRWRQLIEALGVFVYVTRLGDFKDVRGFSHWDNRGVGVIVINNDEDCLAPLYLCHVIRDLLRRCGFLLLTVRIQRVPYRNCSNIRHVTVLKKIQNSDECNLLSAYSRIADILCLATDGPLIATSGHSELRLALPEIWHRAP